MSHATEIIPLRIVVEPGDVEGDEHETDPLPTFPGTITHLIFQFPEGADMKVAVQVLAHDGQIAPAHGTAMRLGGGSAITIPVNIPISGPRPHLRLRGWVDAGASYDTTIDVYVVIQPREG